MRRKRNADADRSQGEYKIDFVGFVQDSEVLDSLGVKQYVTSAKDDGSAKTHEFFLLPAHDKDSQRFGLDLFVHYSVGVNKASVLCPRLMKSVFKKFGIEVPEVFKDGKCPVCELEQKLQEKSNQMRDEIGPDASTSYWKKNVYPLRAYYGKSYAPEPNRYLSWVRPADNMSDDADIQFFFVPAGVFKEAIISKSTDRHGNSLDLANPDAPYILYFQREGSGKEGTKYFGYGIESFDEPMPDSWFEKVPRYTDILVFKTYEEIKTLMGEYIEDGEACGVGAADTKDSVEGEFFERDLESTRRRRKRELTNSPSPKVSTGRRRKVLDVDEEDADKEDAIVEAEERKAIEQEEFDENTEEEVEALARKVRSRRRRTQQVEAEVEAEQEDDIPI